MSTLRLQNRIALVTGASRGIGAAVAKRFAKEGAHVILVARTIGGLEEVDDAIKQQGGQATLVPLNLLDFNKIDELGGVLAKRCGRLDIMVGNAGILGALAPVGHIAPDVWERTFGINVTANYRLIRSFDPLLRQSDAARVMFVTSGVTRSAHPYWGAYAASKAAVESLAVTYAAEVNHTPMRVNIIDPGVVRTKMRQEAMPGENPETLPLPEQVTDIFVDLADSRLTENGRTFRAKVSAEQHA